MDKASNGVKDPIITGDPNNLQILKDDGYLEPHRGHFEYRYKRYIDKLREIEKNEGSLYNFSMGYKKLGFNDTPEGIQFREWAPGAKGMFICGDFNNWNRREYPLKKDQYGNWEIFLPNKEDGKTLIPHNSKVKLHVLTAQDEWADRIPAWIPLAIQNETNKSYDGVYLSQSEEHRYKWKNPLPKKPVDLKVYEAHVGMASTEPKVASYKDFTNNVLPRIAKLGYNCVQLMAIMEHSYYGSFGYHVTNFFAIASRSGMPNDLKELIDTAHGMGICVLMDLVHSHASKNVLDGINMFDGTDYQYFHEGTKGLHALWDSRIFDYSKWEVLRFLLSNLNWYLEEYKFDGFRFDGITSLMYTHHGVAYGFSGNYNEYFSENTEMDGVVYLMLANTLIHRINPEAITIAEDVSGMPGLGRTVNDGGVGFDFRLSMALPDKWIQLLKETKDEDWNMANLVFTLTNRRYDEKCIAYCESHDQAIVGDKTISMWLFDAQIYTNMSVLSEETLTVHRGLALHKMIRLLTIGLGGEGYLNFMGNEFGHPEWIDFPRLENGWSYQHCRRQWDLADNKLLYYYFLRNFDEDMIQLESRYKWLDWRDQYVCLAHEGDKVIAFEKGGLLWIFNFHPTQSFENYRIGTRFPYEHQIVLDSDAERYHGKQRLNPSHEKPFPIIKEGWHNRDNYIQVYLPSRTAIVLKPLDPTDKR
jgi:1,4-alpha-glucan branching enzyme